MKENDTMKRIAKEVLIIDKITNRFNDNDWEPITLTMVPSGATVEITPCFSNDNDKNPNHIEFFLCNSDAMNMPGCDNMRDLARELLDFEDNRIKSVKEKHRCNEFYNKYIKPYSNADICKGNSYFDIIYDAWRDSYNISLDELIKNFNFASIAMDGDSPERVKALVKLVRDRDFYSDWYKDLYGHRP